MKDLVNILNYKKYLLVLLGLVLTANLFAQGSLFTTVVEESTNMPIVGARVYIAGSSIGVVSNKDGDVLLEKIPFGQYELVVSHISFENKYLRLTVNSKQPEMQTKISLIRKITSIEEIEVAVSEKKKQKYTTEFLQAFLGNNHFGKQTTLENPNDLYCNKINGVLQCESDQLLSFTNNATGYNLLFLLAHFQKDGYTVSYSGKPLFVSFGDVTENQLKARRAAYLGSMQHFFNSLMSNSAKESGFEIYRAKQLAENKFVEQESLAGNQILKPAKDGGFAFAPGSSIKVIYTGAIDGNAAIGNSGTFDMGHPAEGDLKSQDDTEYGKKEGHQVSYLLSSLPIVGVSEQGVILEPNAVTQMGYWSAVRVAEMLPLDYSPN